MRSWLLRYWRALLGAIVVVGIAIGGVVYVYWNRMVPIAAMAVNYVLYLSAPVGTLETEIAPGVAAAVGLDDFGIAAGCSCRNRGRLAKLQQDAHLGPLLAAKSDQQNKRRQAQSSLHL